MLKLIVEDDLDLCKASVVESTDKDDRFHPLLLRGIFAVAEKLNRNQRKYHYEPLKKEMEIFVNEDVSKGRAFGDFEHPTDGSVDRERAAVKINKLELDAPRKCWLGEATVMYTDEKHGIKGTPKGDLLKSYIDYDTPIGFSTRGCGEIDGEYVENYKLITIDAVCDPSIGEFCNGVLESKAFMIDTHGQIVECAISDYEKMLNQSTKTFDITKKRQILKNAWDELLRKI